MALTTAQKRRLARYASALDDVGGEKGAENGGAYQCRVTGRHDLPGPHEWGKSEHLRIVYGRREGAYQLVAECKRGCGYTSIQQRDGRTGLLERRSRPRYSNPAYLWKGGEGLPMTVEERAYLWLLQMLTAIQRQPVERVATLEGHDHES
jgi:hypothetical protein